MKRIINGKLYNTETSDRICLADKAYHNGSNWTGQTVSIERKKNGELYAHQTESYDGYGMDNGPSIWPLSEEEAITLMEDCKDTEEVEKFLLVIELSE